LVPARSFGWSAHGLPSAASVVVCTTVSGWCLAQDAPVAPALPAASSQARPARPVPVQDAPGPSASRSDASADAKEAPVVWWRPFGIYDYLGTTLTVGLFYAVEYGIDNPDGTVWDAPAPLIDEPMRNLLVGATRSQRERADRFSDYGWYTSIAYPVLVSAIAPPVRGAGFEMIWELEMMNLRSFAVASLVTRIPHKLLGRKRPNSVGCAKDPDYDVQCGTSAQNQSFPGGHASISMTGAGLACAHHLHAGLYGAAWADAVGCGGALAVATGVVAMRQRADRHWMSDNLVGAAVGLAVGYGLPTVLNYHPFWQDNGPDEAESPAVQPAYRLRWDIVPVATQNTAGAAVVGLF